MNDDALAGLEFPAIVERLAAATATSHGAELVHGLVPSADAEEVSRRQAITAEAVALLDISAEPPLDGIDDVRGAAALAARGGVLAPDALRRIGATIAGGLRARTALESEEELAPLLCELAAAIDRKLGPLVKQIGSVVEDDGSDLRDNASPLLRRLRKELRAGNERVFEALRRLARTPGLREHLQEDFVTQRGGRPVLALKASAPRSIRGIVHDASGSGQTLFVEPFEVVELTNRQAEASAAERDEVDRLLRELSAAVGADAEPLVALVEAAAAVDIAVACGTERRWKSPTRWHSSAHGTRCSTPLLPSRSTSTSAVCARS